MRTRTKVTFRVFTLIVFTYLITLINFQTHLSESYQNTEPLQPRSPLRIPNSSKAKTTTSHVRAKPAKLQAKADDDDDTYSHKDKDDRTLHQMKFKPQQIPSIKLPPLRRKFMISKRMSQKSTTQGHVTEIDHRGHPDDVMSMSGLVRELREKIAKVHPSKVRHHGQTCGNREVNRTVATTHGATWNLAKRFQEWIENMLWQTCTSSFCQHNGVCALIREIPTCTCPSEYSGAHCEVDVSCIPPWCREGQFHRQLPDQLEERLRQVVEHPKLKIPAVYAEAIKTMTSKFSGHPDVLLLTASNIKNIKMLQRLLNKVDTVLVPALAGVKIHLIVYNLGLEGFERNVTKNCSYCTVLEFPFKMFPKYVFYHMKAFGWKPIIILAHAQQADIVMWWDTSIVLNNATGLIDQWKETRRVGLQVRNWMTLDVGLSNTQYTSQLMFYFFGDEPCAHQPYVQVEAGFASYHNEPFVRQAILTPWVGCALQVGCLKATSLATDRNNTMASYVNIRMHRFDQSALSIILSKLFQDHYLGALIHPSWGYYDVIRF